MPTVITMPCGSSSWSMALHLWHSKQPVVMLRSIWWNPVLKNGQRGMVFIFAVVRINVVGRVPYPESIQNLLVSSDSSAIGNNGTRTGYHHHHHIPPFWNDLLQFLEERGHLHCHHWCQLGDEHEDDDIVTLLAATNHNSNDYNESCQQDCFRPPGEQRWCAGYFCRKKKEANNSNK